MVCFDNANDIEIRSDWWTGQSFKSYVIAFEACDKKKRVCANETETEAYFKRNPMQVTTA